MLLKAFRRYSCTVVGDIYNYSNVTDEETQAQRDEGMEGSGHTARQKQSRAYSSGPQATGAVAILTSFHSESADLEIEGPSRYMMKLFQPYMEIVVNGTSVPSEKLLHGPHRIIINFE